MYAVGKKIILHCSTNVYTRFIHVKNFEQLVLLV